LFIFSTPLLVDAFLRQYCDYSFLSIRYRELAILGMRFALYKAGSIVSFKLQR
jgi:hypothetical protein